MKNANTSTPTGKPARLLSRPRPGSTPEVGDASTSDASTSDASMSDANTSVAVTAVAPSVAMGTLYQTTAAAVGLSHQNAVHAQHLQYSLSNAVTLESLGALHSSLRAPDPRLETTLDRVVRVLDSLNSDKPASGTEDVKSAKP